MASKPNPLVLENKRTHLCRLLLTVGCGLLLIDIFFRVRAG